MDLWLGSSSAMQPLQAMSPICMSLVVLIYSPPSFSKFSYGLATQSSAVTHLFGQTLFTTFFFCFNYHPCQRWSTEDDVKLILNQTPVLGLVCPNYASMENAYC